MAQYKYQRAHLLEFNLENQPPTPLNEYYWTGQGTLSFDAGSGVKEWVGSAPHQVVPLKLAPFESTTGEVARKIVGTIAIGKNVDVQRNAVLERDLGPVPCKVHLIRKEVNSTTWIRVKTFEGRTGKSGLKNNLWTFNIEARNHDAFRKNVKKWSHEFQTTQRFNIAGELIKNDMGMEFLSDLQNTKPVAWPN